MGQNRKGGRHLFFTMAIAILEPVAYIAERLLPLPKKQVRAVLFAQGRTGSTLLENLISSTGFFRETGELLSTVRGEIRDPARFVLGLAKLTPWRNLIFHVKLCHLTSDRQKPVDPKQFLGVLNGAGFGVIYLRRRNLVRHRISTLVAMERNKWHTADSDRERAVKIRVDCQRMVKKVEEKNRFRQEEIAALADIPYCELVYEDDLESVECHQATVDKVLSFLGLESRLANTHLEKITPKRLDQLVENYGELQHTLRAHDWGHFIDESMSEMRS